MKHQFGAVGLGEMGHNKDLNMEGNGFMAAGYDLDPAIIRSNLPITISLINSN